MGKKLRVPMHKGAVTDARRPSDISEEDSCSSDRPARRLSSSPDPTLVIGPPRPTTPTVSDIEEPTVDNTPYLDIALADGTSISDDGLVGSQPQPTSGQPNTCYRCLRARRLQLMTRQQTICGDHATSGHANATSGQPTTASSGQQTTGSARYDGHADETSGQPTTASSGQQTTSGDKMMTMTQPTTGSDDGTSGQQTTGSARYDGHADETSGQPTTASSAQQTTGSDLGAARPTKKPRQS